MSSAEVLNLWLVPHHNDHPTFCSNIPDIHLGYRSSLLALVNVSHDRAESFIYESLSQGLQSKSSHIFTTHDPRTLFSVSEIDVRTLCRLFKGDKTAKLTA